jgi:hypothetical protein
MTLCRPLQSPFQAIALYYYVFIFLVYILVLGYWNLVIGYSSSGYLRNSELEAYPDKREYLTLALASDA